MTGFCASAHHPSAGRLSNDIDDDQPVCSCWSRTICWPCSSDFASTNANRLEPDANDHCGCAGRFADDTGDDQCGGSDPRSSEYVRADDGGNGYVGSISSRIGCFANEHHPNVARCATGRDGNRHGGTFPRTTDVACSSGSSSTCANTIVPGARSLGHCDTRSAVCTDGYQCACIHPNSNEFDRACDGCNGSSSTNASSFAPSPIANQSISCRFANDTDGVPLGDTCPRTNAVACSNGSASRGANKNGSFANGPGNYGTESATCTNAHRCGDNVPNATVYGRGDDDCNDSSSPNANNDG